MYFSFTFYLVNVSIKYKKINFVKILLLLRIITTEYINLENTVQTNIK